MPNRTLPRIAHAALEGDGLLAAFTSLACVFLLCAGCGPSVIPDSTGGDGPTDATNDASADGTAGATDSGVPDGPDTGMTNGESMDLGGPPVCLNYATEGCGIPSRRSSIAGATPIGEFETSFAVFGSYAGCNDCVSEANVLHLTFAADPVVLASYESFELLPAEIVQFYFMTNDAFEGPPGQEIPAMVLATRDMSLETAAAVVIFDEFPLPEDLEEPFDPDTAVVITGTAYSDEAGWDISGDFVATYCPRINFCGL